MFFDRRRQIKRDLAGNVTDKKGIAGIRTIGNTGTTVSSTTATDRAVDDLSNLGNLFWGIDNKTVHSMAMGNLNKSKETSQPATTVIKVTPIIHRN